MTNEEFEYIVMKNIKAIKILVEANAVLCMQMQKEYDEYIDIECLLDKITDKITKTKGELQ